MTNLSKDEADLLKKRNRLIKFSLKKHKITHESGRSTKELWRRMVTSSAKIIKS